MTYFDNNKPQPSQPPVPIPPEIQLNGDEGRIRGKNGEERDVKIPKLTWA